MSDKHLSEFNVAFCELSGFVSVGSKYENLSLKKRKTIIIIVVVLSKLTIEIVSTARFNLYTMYFILFSGDEIYDMLMEDIIVDNIKNEMGQFDDDQLIADLKELFIS